MPRLGHNADAQRFAELVDLISQFQYIPMIKRRTSLSIINPCNVVHAPCYEVDPIRRPG